MHPEHQRKIYELIDLLAENLKIECGRLYHCGEINPEIYNPNYYTLANVLVTAALRQHVNDLEPSKQGKAKNDLENLSHFCI